MFKIQWIPLRTAVLWLLVWLLLGSVLLSASHPPTYLDALNAFHAARWEETTR